MHLARRIEIQENESDEEIFYRFIISAIFFSYGDAKCRSVCNDNYDKCVANIINLPEPRTFEEQETLQACYDKRGDCEHSCEDPNEPTEDQQKQEEGK